MALPRLLALVALAVGPVAAQPRFSNVFQSHMVLQRDQPLVRASTPCRPQPRHFFVCCPPARHLPVSCDDTLPSAGRRCGASMQAARPVQSSAFASASVTSAPTPTAAPMAPGASASRRRLAARRRGNCGSSASETGKARCSRMLWSATCTSSQGRAISIFRRPTDTRSTLSAVTPARTAPRPKPKRKRRRNSSARRVCCACES